MKKILTIIVLSLCFIIPSQADDIKEFEIEGMSIGDSLLKYMSKSQIETNKYPVIKGGKKFYEVQKVPSNIKSDIYEDILLYFKNDDPDRIIIAIAGRNYYENKIEECYRLQKTIVREMEEIFPNIEKTDRGRVKLDAFPNGDSYKKLNSFFFKNGGNVQVGCYDYSKKDTNSTDRLSVVIFSQQYVDWYMPLK